MSKHAPGPWSIDQNAMEHWMITAQNSERHRGYIATLSTTNTQSEANAHLIAAAPQMLEALESWSKLDGFETDDELTVLSAQMEAAIKAAKGEI